MSLVENLCEKMLLSEAEILKFSATAPHRYKVYSIPKRNSTEKRVIAHPSKELKYIQRALIPELSKMLSCHEAAFAYRNGIGIKDNAAMHSGNPYILKMDFKNFFNSITPSMLINAIHLRGFSLDDKDERLLRGIGFWKPQRKGNLVLSVGAPSSPIISNGVMYDFDVRLSQECKRYGITYTRYADDVTMSTSKNEILFGMPDVVKKNLEESLEGLMSVNEGKTVFSSKKHNRHVTGITLTNDDKLSIGRERKRLISAMIHRSLNGKLTSEEQNQLKGLLAFAYHVEPVFLTKMGRKYGETLVDNLLKGKWD